MRRCCEEVDPGLMLLAKQHGEVVGFVFAPPDFLQRKYQERVDAIVIKTVAILPRKELSGLGRVLIVDMLQNAVLMGYDDGDQCTDARGKPQSKNQ